MPSRRKKVEKDVERTYGELRQLFIDKYRSGHLDSIKSVKKVIVECRKLLKDAEKPREQKRLENLIKRTEKELVNLRNKTPEVIKEANRMQKELDSLK